MMNRIVETFVAIAIVGLATQSAQAQLIDDFESGDFSAYTTNIILDVDFADGQNTSALASVGGEVTLDTTAFQTIEQIAITRSDVTLEIGQELQIDVLLGAPADRGSQDFGLWVGGSAPGSASAAANDVRADFLAVFQRNNTADVLTALFNDDFTGGNTNSFGDDPAYDTLFIARTGADTYEGGIYDAGTRSVLREEVTITTDAAGPTIGLYADVRAAGTIQSGFDNLRIVAAVPEPSSLALLGLVTVVGLVRRRKN